MKQITNSQWLVEKRPWHANMTDMNHLGKAMLIKPNEIYPKVMQMFSAQYIKENPLYALLSNTGREEVVDKREWTWDLRGASCRPLVVMAEGPSNAGKNLSNFDLAFDENFAKPGDVLSPGNPNVQVRVVRAPRVSGKNYIYTLRGNWDDAALSVPAKYLKTGQKWGKLFSQYEEGAEEGGSTTYALPLKLSGRASRYRKSYKVTGDVRNEGVLAVKLPDYNGKMHDTWIGYNEAEFWGQWAREISVGQWYSRSTNTVMGSTNRPVYGGPGIQELLEYSNRHFYTHLTGKLIEEFILDAVYGRLSPNSDTNLIGMSGEWGMRAFHQAVMDEYRKTGFITVDENFIQRTNSPLHKMALAYGAQFVTYRMANGRTLTMMHNPLYDDRELNFEINPLTGFPYESGRITLLDMTGEGAGSNIRLTRVKNSYKVAYVHGTTTPYGPNNGSAAHTGDYYEFLVEDSNGIQIDDVTRCGELIPTRL